MKSLIGATQTSVINTSKFPSDKNAAGVVTANIADIITATSANEIIFFIFNITFRFFEFYRLMKQYYEKSKVKTSPVIHLDSINYSI